MAKTVKGTVNDDSLVGSASADLIEGLAGDDIINGYGGDDVLMGGIGDDLYVFGGASTGTAAIVDAEGADTIDTDSAEAGVTLDLHASGESLVDGQKITLGGTVALGSQPLDLVLLQDLSGSFGDDVIKVQSLATTLVSEVQALNDDVQFGISSFVDKPAGSFGSEYSGDYVYKTDLALTASGADFKATLDDLTVFYGGDYPESQLEALYQLALRADEVGFRNEARKVVVLTTDADYHKAGDGLSAGILADNNGDEVLDGSPAGSGEDYPMVSAVKEMLASTGIVPIFAVTSDQISTYEALVAELGVGIVTELAKDSKNLVDLIGSSLEEISLSVDSIENAIGSGFADKITANSLVNELTGGDGADSFIYTSASDVAGDVVTDFADGNIDKVDFSALAGYSFIGNADFTAANQIRYEIDADGNTAIQLSNDAKATEYSMVLTGEFALAETKKDSLVLVGDKKATPPEPVITRISLAENSDVDTVVVKSLASATKDDEQRFEILEGNEDVDGDGDEAFAIDETGKIVVNDSDDLDFEEQSTFDLLVGVETDYSGEVEEKSIGIDLIDMPENFAPVVEDASFTIKENAKVKSKLGSIEASDEEGDDLEYSIVGGNLDLDGDGKMAFAINKANGNITVTDNGDLNFEYSDTISLVIGVSDGVNDMVESQVSVTMQNVKEKNATIKGTKANDILCGGEGNDKITGGNGNDLIKGSLGKDILTGGTGNDVFVFDTKPSTTTNVDTIKDFTTKTDKIALLDTIFTEFNAEVTSSLDISQFYSASGATKGRDADDRIVYDTKTGALYYDEDGSGSTSAVKIAIIGDAGTAAKLSIADFVIV